MIFFKKILFSFFNTDCRITQTSLDDVQQKYENREGEGELTGPRKNPLHFGADPDEGRNIFFL